MPCSKKVVGFDALSLGPSLVDSTCFPCESLCAASVWVLLLPPTVHKHAHEGKWELRMIRRHECECERLFVFLRGPECRSGGMYCNNRLRRRPHYCCLSGVGGGFLPFLNLMKGSDYSFFYDKVNFDYFEVSLPIILVN